MTQPKKMFLLVQNILVLILLGSFLYIKLNHFFELSNIFHLLLNMGVMIFTYLVIQPIWVKTFPKQKRKIIYTVTALIFALCVLWDFEHYLKYSSTFLIQLYIIPVIIVTMFISIQAGFIFAILSTFSFIGIKSLFLTFEPLFLLEASLLFMLYALTTFLVSQAIKTRDVFHNKQHILIMNSSALTMGMNSEGKIDICNYAMADFLDMEHHEIVGKYFWEVENKLHQQELKQVFQYLKDDQNVQELEVTILKNDRPYTFIMEKHTVKNDGLVGGTSLVLRDITERKEMEQRLHEMAITDGLTGLYNRRFFEKKFQEEIQRAKRYHRPISLLMIDIDHFKKFNDTYGHSTGDEVLKKVAQTLATTLRETDIIARLGGEEFAILLPEGDEEAAKNVAEKIVSIIQTLKIPIDQERHVSITVSVGATTRGENFDCTDMMEDADQALYHAKNNGRNQFVFRSPSSPIEL